MASSSLLTAFDDGGTRFALVTPDGRIKSYDTVTGRLRTSIAAGPAEAHLCAAWLPASGGGKGAAAASAPTVLAVGTASGDVAAYDTATAELRWRAAGVNDGGVSCLAAAAGTAAAAAAGGGGGGGKRGGGSANASAAAHPPRLVTCGADAMVVSLDPHTGEPAPLAGAGAANGHAAAAPPAAVASFRGSKHPVTAAALSPDGARALVGATTLALWELSPSAAGGKPRRLAKLTGHPLPVRVAAFSPALGHHALTAARGERGVSVWRASAEALGLSAGAGAGAGAATPPSAGKQRRPDSGGVVAAAAANLAMDDEAVQLSTCAAPGGPAGAFFAAAVGEGGECLVWRVAAAGGAASGPVEVAPQARVRVAGAAAGGEAILAAHLEPTAGQGGVILLVVRGSPAAPAFERVHIAPRAAGAPGPAPVVELAPAAGGGLLPPTRPAAGGGGEARASGPADVLGPDNAGAMVRSRAPAEEGDDSDEAGSDGGEAGPASPGVPSPPRRKRGAPADEEGDEEDEEEEEADEDEGQTLGARLAALDRQQQQPGPAAAAGAAAGAATRRGAGAGGGGAAAAKPPPLLTGVRGAAAKADSLAVMLTQALRSGDRALLERCLSVSDPRVVNNTARRLVPVDAAALLRAGVERLQSSPRRAASLAAWIRAALVHHAAYLTGAPGAQPVMASLYRTIEARLAAQRALLSLAGRLDLLLAASAASSSSPSAAAGGGGGGARALAADDGPRVVYQESEDEDDEEVEDAFARVGLEGTDDEDEDEDDGDDEGGESDDDDLLVGGGAEADDSDAEGEDDSMLDEEDEDEDEEEEDDDEDGSGEDDDADDDDDDDEEEEGVAAA